MMIASDDAGLVLARRHGSILVLTFEYGSAWLLQRLVGTGRAIDLLLSGRIVLGREAATFGLVDHLAEADQLIDTVTAYAADLVENCSPASMAVLKNQVIGSMDETFTQSFALSEELVIQSFLRPDQGEGVKSCLEKRQPRFDPLPASITKSLNS